MIPVAACGPFDQPGLRRFGRRQLVQRCHDHSLGQVGHLRVSKHLFVGELGQSDATSQHAQGHTVGAGELRVDLWVVADPEGTAGEAGTGTHVDLDQLDVLRLEVVLPPELGSDGRVRNAAARVWLDRITLDLVEVPRPGQIFRSARVGVLVDTEQSGVAFQGVGGTGDAPLGQSGGPQRRSSGEGRLESLGQRLVEKRLPVARGLRVVDAQGMHGPLDGHAEHPTGRRRRSKATDDTGRQKPHHKVPAFGLLLPKSQP